VFDNPAVDTEQYIVSLSELKQANPLRYKQMLLGDWDAVEGGRFKKEWFGGYRQDPHLADTVILTAGPAFGGGEVERFRPEACGCFQTCDPAATISKASDYFVLSTWIITPKANVVWWGCHRDKHEIQEQVGTCQSLYRYYRPQFLGVEVAGTQQALFQYLCRSTNPPMILKELRPMGQDKFARAAGAIALAGSGRIFLPETPRRDFPLEDVLEELIRFTGDGKRDSHDDCCDTLAYACSLLPFVRPGSGGGRAAPIRHTNRDQPWTGLR
jgi:phage terminase large subunit-like protein